MFFNYYLFSFLIDIKNWKDKGDYMKKDLHQSLMDSAYDKWKQNKDWNNDQFFNHLDYLERVAVVLGNLNYQVGNGGFSQWEGNGYKETHSSFLLSLKNEMEKEYPKYTKLYKGLEITEKAIEYLNSNPIDDIDDYDEDEYNNETDIIEKELDKLNSSYYELCVFDWDKDKDEKDGIEHEMGEFLEEIAHQSK